jgi:hypothetical protein
VRGGEEGGEAGEELEGGVQLVGGERGGHGVGEGTDFGVGEVVGCHGKR